jgi:hypothetical protein
VAWLNNLYPTIPNPYMKIKALFTTTLAEDMPAGPYPGQHFHPKGSEVSYANTVNSEKIGDCSFMAPDPVFFYLNLAEEGLEKICKLFPELDKNSRMLLFKTDKGLDKVKALKEDLVHEYLQNTIQFIIMLFSAVEAFVNQNTPVTDSYSVRLEDGKVRTYKTKEEFERCVPTKRKLVFLFECKSLGNPNRQPFWPFFEHLNGLRNDIIHLKTKGKSTFHCYQDIYKDLFDTNFEEMFGSIKTVFTFFNKDFFN